MSESAIRQALRMGTGIVAELGRGQRAGVSFLVVGPIFLFYSWYFWSGARAVRENPATPEELGALRERVVGGRIRRHMFASGRALLRLHVREDWRYSQRRGVRYAAYGGAAVFIGLVLVTR